MKKINILLLTTLLLCFTGCEDKKTQTSSKISKEAAPKEVTPLKVTKEETEAVKKEEEALKEKALREEALKEKALQEEALKKEEALRKKYTFVLSDLDESNRSVYFQNKHLEITDVKEKVILLNFFATWCSPCKGQVPYLADLKKKYEGKLFIAGILVNDKPDEKSLKTFIETFGINYYLSNSEQNDDFAKLAIQKLKLEENFPLPLSILFKNGYYYAHYEGAVPIEMLEHDIKKAMRKE